MSEDIDAELSDWVTATYVSHDMSEDDIDEVTSWIKGLPDAAKKAVLACPPTQLYLLTISDHIVYVLSYSDEGTMTVAVTGQYNLVEMERAVFGITPDQLVPCEAPGPDVKVGVTLTDEQQLRRINVMRQANGLEFIESLDEVRTVQNPGLISE